MAQSIDVAFVRQYEKDVHKAYQRMGSKLRGTVRTINGVVGGSAFFPKVGKGIATQKTRNGVITPMNLDHTTVQVNLEDWYAGDYVDKLDLLKTNVDERQVIVDAGAFALGRKTDDLIINQLASTTTFVGDYSTGLTYTLLAGAIEALNNADAPDDGQRFGILSAHAWEEFLSIPETSSADFVGDKYPYLKGSEARVWRNIVWMQHTGLPLASTDDRDCFLYHKTAVGHAIAQDVVADFDWQGNMASWFINNMMSMGAGLIDASGAVEIRVDDNIAVT
jgi:hypothetical protein